MDYDLLIEKISDFLADSKIRCDLIDWLDEEAGSIMSLIDAGQSLPDDVRQTVADALCEIIYQNCEQVLCLGWDGNFPGCSGAVWINEIAGYYFVTSSDYVGCGPLATLEEALKHESFNNPTAGAEIDSNVIEMEQLLYIAKGVVDWENEADILVNGVRYSVVNGELVCDAAHLAEFQARQKKISAALARKAKRDADRVGKMQLGEFTWGGRIRSEWKDKVLGVAKKYCETPRRSFEGSSAATQETEFYGFLDGGVRHSVGTFGSSSGTFIDGDLAKAFVMYELGLDPCYLLKVRDFPGHDELKKRITK